MTLAKSPSVLSVFFFTAYPFFVSVLAPSPFPSPSILLLHHSHFPRSSSPLPSSSTRSTTITITPPSDLFELTFHHESANKFRGATVTGSQGRGGERERK